METITLTIDGVQVNTEKGATVLEAAQEAGIYIPTLCSDPDLEPYGACRLCIVEIEKMRGLPTACTTPAADGMIVHTSTPAVNEARRDIIALLLTDYPADCPKCTADQQCDLHKVASYVGFTEQPYRESIKSIPIDTSNPFFDRDLNYCILCGKCVRTCDEITGMGAIQISSRGYTSLPSTFGDRPLIQSNCISCGECIVRCPTGALMPKERRQPTQEVKTICPYCGVGCGIVLGTDGRELINVSGNRESPVNSGRLCVKGRFGIVDFVNHSSRLRSPLIRKNGELMEATWEEALDLVASKLDKYRGDAFAGISSAKCTNEDNYIFQKFTRAVMGTNNVDHCARL
jgi:predicted molibdopterin-dependent oxidoreductase YjgC